MHIILPKMDKSNVSLERMRTFVRVAERNSLSAVARELGIGQSTVTRHLRELEAALGVSLISRTTRRVTLTEDGARYYTNSLQILRLVEKAAEEARGNRSAPAGTIKLSCTAAIGVLHISRLIFEFQDRYPEIGVDLGLTDERVNLVREGVDSAIRLGPLADSSMKLKPLGKSRRLLVASPQYLAKRGRPAKPQDLRRHDSIRMSNIAGSDSLVLTGPAMDQQTVPFDGRLRVDHGLSARQALIAGRGIAPPHLWLVSDLLKSGVLEIVLADYSVPPVPLNMLIVPERANIARVRLLITFLTEQARRIPGIEANVHPSSAAARR